VHLDPDGAVCVFASAPANVLLDATGWQEPGVDTLVAQTPQRILDTRTR